MVTTDLTTPATAIVKRYAGRWAIEVTFAAAKNTTGVGEARNRTPRAVERTVPFGLYTQSIVTWLATTPPSCGTAVTTRLVHHQATPVLTRHGRQTPARPHRRPISARIA
ncbi:hypothetical protein [Planosporangium mesophilum]|uniref:Uncharacterized protein n=1 Tax=Planosporangium mesophilum TaxID=689768 RepID=A0A8J3TFY7_9ACTN|nr:hypothetical protein [Planosporangium mesophilum]NJC86547.1 hypothetical protein [Planosporangium mesophilum]GII26213.1 hypothetical protein Pme01_58100 [Planosporangium mesophilum]